MTPAAAPRSPPVLALLAAGLFCAGWLLPVRREPWPWFHADLTHAAALACLAVAWLREAAQPLRLSRVPAFLPLLAAVPLAQHATGLVVYGGDAWMASLYLAGFACSVAVGQGLVRSPHAAAMGLLLARCLVLVGAVSALLALRQWLRWPAATAWWPDTAVGLRSVANLQQPNLLATLLVLSLTATVALNAHGRLPNRATWVLVVLTAAGLILCRSRTGCLELIVLSLCAVTLGPRVGLRLSRLSLTALTACVVLGTAAFFWQSPIEAARPVSGPLPAVEAANARLIHWATLADALRAAPWLGYGWNQVALAQAAADLGHPGGEFIEYSHNLLLDLCVWNGLPLGLVLIAAAAAWSLAAARRCRDLPTACMLAALLAIGLHAMTEFPHGYFGFLMLAGLLIGAVESRRATAVDIAIARRVALAVVWSVFALTALVVHDYLLLEPQHAAMRRDWALYGPPMPAAPVAEVQLLSQLQELLQAMRQPLDGSLSPAGFAQMQRVARRYGYAPVLLRLAIAAQHRGQPELAAATLDRLCRLHNPNVCQASRRQFAQPGT